MELAKERHKGREAQRHKGTKAQRSTKAQRYKGTKASRRREERSMTCNLFIIAQSVVMSFLVWARNDIFPASHKDTKALRRLVKELTTDNR